MPLILDRPYRMQELVSEMRSVSRWPPCEYEWKRMDYPPITVDLRELLPPVVKRPWYLNRDRCIQVTLAILALIGWIL